MIPNFLKHALHSLLHLAGRISRRYYVEDYIRVYPGQIAFNRLGKQRASTDEDRKNYLNHVKFYRFAGQFAGNKDVADIGCGSGYGCEVLRQCGARSVAGADISSQAIKFAGSHFGNVAEFSIQEVTNLAQYPDRSFDLTVCSEVLEHIKEYSRESPAVSELVRITRPGGMIAMGTPNSELLENHGFTYREMNSLLQSHFSEFLLFENAFVPFGSRKALWEDRLRKAETGIVITQQIRLDESVFPAGESPEVKEGNTPSPLRLGDREIDTSFLHNTHSWVALGLVNAPD